MSYATTDDLADFLRSTPLPADADRMLEEASDDIDAALVGVRYAVDAYGQPTDPKVIATFRKAAVRQVHWMMDRDDETGALDDVQSMSTGARSVTRRTVGPQAGTARVLGPRAARVLRTAGVAAYPLLLG